MAQLQVRRLGYALGAEVRGVDLHDLSAGEVDAIRKAWLEHLVLCFPGQNLTREELIAFGTRLGKLDFSTSQRHPGEMAEISVLTEQPVNGNAWNGYKAGQVWHSDKSFTPQPISASILNCKELPPVGGDTMWANQYMAYETLSPQMQRLIEPLWAIHDIELRLRAAPVNDARTPEEIKRASDAKDETRPGGKARPSIQPAVRVHDETGRKALYIGQRIRRFVGMSDDESRAILDYLKAHAVRYEFTYRHRWAVDDVVMWDNRCTLHIALCDYDLQRDKRFIVKIQVLGPVSGAFYTPEAEALAGRPLEPAGT